MLKNTADGAPRVVVDVVGGGGNTGFKLRSGKRHGGNRRRIICKHLLEKFSIIEFE